MGIVTILRFLIGQRQAILDIAASRHANWLGLLFVFSAGFAREYDGEDLLHEPWHLLIPLVASLATSTLLYGVLWIVCRGWSTFANEWSTFRAFVSLYWMTAPLAWLYAIPVERFLPAGDSVSANYWLLTIVATWRVVLIIRVASVLFRAPAAGLVFPVLLFSHTVLVALTILVPAPILAIMGGVRLSEGDQVIAGVNLLILFTTHLVWPVLAFASFLSLFGMGQRERMPSLASEPQLPVQRSAWYLAAAALAIWLLILPFTQPQQQRRWQAERLLRDGRIGEGLEYMAQHQPDDFPPHWDPPPRLGYANELPAVIDIVEQVSQRPDLPPWIIQEYLQKFGDHFERYFTARRFWEELSDRDWDRYLDFLEKHPLSPEPLDWQIKAMQDDAFSNRTPERIERFRRVMQAKEAESPSPTVEAAAANESEK